ncbi:hypothetical protein A2333_01195 [Candidatus Wolfebacteria bacterium RIFOXYB2_FULL_49_7]|uniref:DUF6922 domain-containing protein n=1 Tax=Candidatus Wolfebacteria bacterium RIFOXYB1_FULL_54_12 TaxID=1802559 RepID=A0A1F8DY69_9BACT|nr:MAG: hypothetical protein A2372_00890 [Candidatus Wolfebacteria bacterium RIFOXYB1_FULL_54_12]OGM96470.1 MAG: hypothetical protein A2333_01195 [Candidatus Wolfebacteria bacterium RIFOXYB2_FULL_49_7]
MKTLDKKSLFWDVRDIDPQKNARFVIERILAFGDLDDFKWSVDRYGVEAIKDVCAHSKVLDRKSASFWNNYFRRNA